VGSFDEAIRQHLDLKRRRGADPSVVAHMEREAFGMGPEHAKARPAPNSFDGEPFESHCAPANRKGEIALNARRATLSQETVEIDMDLYINARRVEDEGERHAYDWGADDGAPDIGDPTSSFEWETPYRARLRGAA
jgi:hypothetical protein